MDETLNDIPVGYCQCRCGLKTPLAKWSDKRTGIVKGSPTRYITGHHIKSANNAVRFWAKVVGRQDVGACHLWTGSVGKNGYGWLSYQGTLWYAHRLAWFLTNGKIPDGLFVCHKCDVQTCCNPAHLFVGTSADNSRDMRAKGRHRVGSQTRCSRLTELEVKRIRSLSAACVSVSCLAECFEVERHTIRAILRRRTWKHVA